MRTKNVTGLLFVCLISTLAVAQVTYTVTDLGSLSPTAINSWAQVVGNYNGHGFLWETGQRMRGLGLLPGGTFSTAASINDVGIVAGSADGFGKVTLPYQDQPSEDCNDLIQPFVWTKRNGMKGLGTVGGSWNGGYWCTTAFSATDINARGEMVGGTGHSSYSYAFSWTNAGGITLFGDSWPNTWAYAINDRGQIVGQDATAELFSLSGGHAELWKNGTSADLGTLEGGADLTQVGSAAYGINDWGQIVGWSETTTDFSTSSPRHAVLWNSGGVIQDLGTLPGDSDSVARKINFFGLVVGISGDSYCSWTNLGHPFVWSARTGMRDLNTLIPRNSGWVLNSTADINFWGQIVGEGTRNGQAHGFLLTPRDPFNPF